jgi:hypothetical protein
MTNEHVQYLTDTINGVTITDQAKRRNVSGSSQSSVLKTAMRNMLKQKAVRANKDNYNVIANDKKVQHLNRHLAYWQTALNDFLASTNYDKSQTKTIFSDKIPKSENINYRRPIETIFYADDIEQAFDAVSSLKGQLTAYDGALLMYNTIVKLYKIKY